MNLIIHLLNTLKVFYVISLTMKKIILTTLLAVIALASCQKESQIIENYESDRGILVHKISEKFPEGVRVKNGTLYFDSQSDFFKSANLIANMTNDEFIDFCQLTGFNSYRADFYKKELKYEQKINKLIENSERNNTELIVSDDKPVPSVKSHLYRSIIDLNGIFYVGKTKNVVKGTNIEGYESSNTKSGEVLIGKTSYLIDKPKPKTTVNQSYTYSKYTVECSCRDRRAITKPTVHMTAYYHDYDITSNFTLEIFMDGLTKRWGSWKDYSTTYTIQAISFNGVSYPNMHAPESIHHTFTITRTDYFDVHSFVYKFATGGTAHNPLPFYKDVNNDGYIEYL